MVRKNCCLVLATLLASIQSPAQTTDGLITGTITDSSGASIPGAQVDVTNEGTGALSASDELVDKLCVRKDTGGRSRAPNPVCGKITF